VPRVPAYAQRLHPWLHQITPSEYRNPHQLPDGGVLVVGASATGVQLAEEIRQAGRDVVLSAGRHTRLPRCYRGRDTWWWLERIGVLDEATDEVSDLQRARALPSFQLVGRPDGRTIDLGTLRDAGVRILGRAVNAEGSVLHLQDDLAQTTGAAQAALERLLARIDIVADEAGAPPAVDAVPPYISGLHRLPSTSDLLALTRCCGPRVIGETTRGSTSRLWMRLERSATTAASPHQPGFMSSA
jgi:putative flavoprotein involved in K+ transport